MKRRLLFLAFSIISVFVLAFSFSNQNVEFNSNTTIRDVEVSQEIKKEDCQCAYAADYGEVRSWCLGPSKFDGLGCGSISPAVAVTGGVIATVGIGYASVIAANNLSQSQGSSSIPNKPIDGVLEKPKSNPLHDLADDLLENEENDYGWTSESLVDALGKSMNVTKEGKVEKVTELTQEHMKVYLGVYIPEDESSYEQIGFRTNGSVVFSMERIVWNQLQDIYGVDGMWILNQFFFGVLYFKKL